MTTSLELKLGIAALIVLQLLTAFSAIALIGRMGPASRKILEGNSDSLIAVDEMLAALTRLDEQPEQARASFLRALGVARSNTTAGREQGVFERIQADAPAALAGDPEARRRAVAALEELGAIQHNVMLEAEANAERLGQAGIWAAVILALGGVMLGSFIVRSMNQRLILPVAEIHSVLQAHARGDEHRRCQTALAPEELASSMEVLNGLLERRARRNELERLARASRAALAQLIEDDQRPLVITDDRGQVLVANRGARELLASERGRELREGLGKLALEPPDTSRFTPLDGGSAFLVRLT